MTATRTDRSPTPRRRARAALSAAAVVVTATVGAGFGTALLAPAAAALITPTSTTDSDTAAAQAITALIGARAADPEIVPAGFAAEAGYRPVVRGGLLVNPDGGCSSPIALPSSFDIPCKAHDLGYDLLRYARRHGGALGPWARQGLDSRLDQRMHAACTVQQTDDARTGCYAMANLAGTAVDMNSWRQGYGNPVHERLGWYGVAGVGAGLATLAWYSRRRRPEGAYRDLATSAVPA
ncbi:hypothetical protein G4X40_21800 [Rhodococcus sp. D2-41]|uniref:Phospholipase n=1 Tax=Speluncibacter jeojiensis TaxID=2710754 RepID=A0A9X4RFN6_9ACTN|nr:hypothetical protein [Rhodococcus sp. D2-41]MDG3012778.1 hypothetical protein [Rhodococcus sp. D2-41]MDG3017240.1 hypothetical protein [Corynebacteriales bacterium D3-21]